MSGSASHNQRVRGDELGKLISLHLDSRISDEQFAQLQYTLEVDESARDFYIAFIETHARLEQSLKQPEAIRDQSALSDRELLDELCQTFPRRRRRNYLTILGLPLVLLLLIGALLLLREAPRYATVSDARDAETQQSQHLEIGNRLISFLPYTLKSGHIELLFGTGTKVLITAPAEFEITGPNELRFTAGKLVARITTPDGKGFTVNTPDGALVDLGTLFGVEIDAAQSSSVQVFKGEVELIDRTGTKTVLPAGETRSCAAGKQQWQAVEKLSPQFYQVVHQKKRGLAPNMVFVDDTRHSLFGIDEFQGTRYLMYSATPIKERAAVTPDRMQQWAGVAPHFVIVHFDEPTQRWHLQANELAVPFKPNSTDLLLARIDDGKTEADAKQITYFAHNYSTIHGIASGYEVSDIQVVPDLFEQARNSGDYSIDGSYLIRKPD